MKTDINIELFKRYAPKKKGDIISSLTATELFAITEDTIKRIIKEVGNRRYRSREKELQFSSEYKIGNGWNSWIESIGIYNNRLYITIYMQMDGTDTTFSEGWNTFFKRDEYVGKAFETNRYGDKIPNYYSYSEDDKARFMRSLLYQYVQMKYSKKHSTNEK